MINLIFIPPFAKINSEFFKPLISRPFLLPCYDLFGCFLNISTSDLKYGCQSPAQFDHLSVSIARNTGKSSSSLFLPPPLPAGDTPCAAAETHLQVKRFGFGKTLLEAAHYQPGSVLLFSCATSHLTTLKSFPFLYF